MNSSLDQLRVALSDRYTVDRELGRGGMATVYLAHDLRHDRDVAIKVLHEDLGATLGPERFLAEIKTTAKLQHPHILPLLDSGDANGLLFYVMPYVEGETLRVRLTRETQLPIEDAVLIAREVADALGFAHGHGIVHRDIKPENILLQGGHALVADFGIALAVQHAGGARLTQSGLSLGTPQYMAPEQAMGEKSVGPSTDIYALGAVTYEMLTGEPPFTGANVQAIVAKVLSSDPAPPTTTRKLVPAHVEAAVLWALAKLPADRPASATAFAATLSGTGATPVRPLAQPGGRALSARLIRSAPWLVAAAAVAALVVMEVRQRPTPPALRALVALSDSMPLVLEDADQSSIGPRIALAPDGRTFAYTTTSAGRRRLAVRSIGSLQSHLVSGSEGAVAPFFSPDGRWIAFFAGDELRKTSIDALSASVVAKTPEGAVAGLWTDVGSIVFSSASGYRLFSVAAEGGDVRIVADASTQKDMCGWATLSAVPSSPWVLHHDRTGFMMCATNLKTGELRFITQRPGTASAGATAQQVWGSHPTLVDKGQILFSPPATNVLVMAPFDLRAMAITGPAVPVQEGIRKENYHGVLQYAVSSSGMLIYVPGEDVERAPLVWLRDGGRVDTLPFAPRNYITLSLSHDGRRVIAAVRAAAGGFELVQVDLTAGTERRLAIPFRVAIEALWEHGDSTALVPAHEGALGWGPGMALLRVFVASGRLDTLVLGPWNELNFELGDVSVRGEIVSGTTSRGLPPTGIVVFEQKEGRMLRLLRPLAGITPFHPVLSPDNEWVAFNDLGARTVSVLRWRDSTAQPIRLPEDLANSVRWDPRGDGLIYRTSTGAFVSRTITLQGSHMSFGPPRPFGRAGNWGAWGGWYGVSADGRSILIPDNTKARSASRVGIVTDFRAEIGRTKGGGTP